MASKFRPVEVEWTDSCGNSSWGPLKDKLDHPLSECRSVGYLVEHTSEHVAIIQSEGYNGPGARDSVDHFLAIPARAVKSLRYLDRRTKMAKKAHPGFKAVQSKIAQKYGMKRAGAILGSSTRKASPAAKKANPRLKRVKG